MNTINNKRKKDSQKRIKKVYIELIIRILVLIGLVAF